MAVGTPSSGGSAVGSSTRSTARSACFAHAREYNLIRFPYYLMIIGNNSVYAYAFKSI